MTWPEVPDQTIEHTPEMQERVAALFLKYGPIVSASDDQRRPLFETLPRI